MQKKYKLITLALSSFLLLGCENKSTVSHVHTYSEDWSSDKNAHFHKCTYAGCSNKSNVEDHTFGDDGKCTVCGYYDSSKIKDIEDSEVIYMGTSEGHYKVDSKGNRITQLEAHVLVDSNGDDKHKPVAATCTMPGKGYKKCSVCGRYVDYTIAALGHDFVKDESQSISATCTEGGRIVEKCSRCNEENIRDVVATGHDWDNWEVIEPATTTEAGAKKRKCKICNTEEVDVIPKLQEVHTHTFGTAWEHDANTHWHPATCGHNVKGNEDAHSFGDYVTVTAATETQNGVKRKTCETCGYYVEETIPALEFIERLIRHIPEKHFKMIRYYGVYARHKESDNKLRRAINSDTRNYLIRTSNWRNNIFRYFGYDPLCCQKCNSKMIYLELRFNHKHVSLEEMYEKVMAKARLPA